MNIEIVLGDIVLVKADAIVNAANTSLLGGSGVDGAIHRAAGPELLEDCKKLSGCKTGEAKITKAYNLDAKYVIHAVGPIWKGGHYKEAELLGKCYQEVLELADDNGCETVAIPSLSTGAYGYPVEKAARVAVGTIIKFSDKAKNLKTVKMVCFEKRRKDIYEMAILYKLLGKYEDAYDDSDDMTDSQVKALNAQFKMVCLENSIFQETYKEQEDRWKSLARSVERDYRKLSFDEMLEFLTYILNEDETKMVVRVNEGVLPALISQIVNLVRLELKK